MPHAEGAVGGGAEDHGSSIPPHDPLEGVDHVVVVAAHPDDETLGVGGLLARLDARTRVDVVVASDGEASHPRSPTHAPADLSARRRDEVRDAVSLLAPHARLHLLGLPDGGLEGRKADLTAAVVRLARPGAGGRTAVLSTYRHDGHPDHEATARAAAAAAWRTDARLLEFPIWWWHWRPGEDPPGGHVHRIPLTERERELKTRATEGHRSQVAALSDRPGDEVLLPEEVLAHFRGDEVLVATEPGEASPFEDLHVRTADPWDVGGWFERRKRALTLAALPHERYAVGLEVGCSVGALTRELATRCDRLVAVDEAPAAVAAAARDAVPGLRAVVAQLPEQWDVVPDGLELVVLSEVGYFLSPGRLRALAARVREASAAQERATVLACHWRHEIVGWPLRADDVHAILDQELGLPVRSTVVEDDVLLTVWSR